MKVNVREIEVYNLVTDENGNTTKVFRKRTVYDRDNSNLYSTPVLIAIEK